VAADFARLVSLACHDLRTPLATVQGFAKTLLRTDGLEPEKQARYLALIDAASDELVELLDLLSLASRLEGGRYEPVLREVDSLELAPEGATGTGAVVLVEPDHARRALAALARAAARHGGVEVAIAVDGAELTIAPVTEAAGPIVLGEEPRDLGAAVAVRLLRALRAEVALDADRLVVALPA
jgi:signal transduction histidine kinase